METNRERLAMWLREVGSEKGVTWELIAFGKIWVVDCKLILQILSDGVGREIHMPRNKTFKNSLGTIHLTDFHAPIEMPLEAIPLGVEVFTSNPIHSKTPKPRFLQIEDF